MTSPRSSFSVPGLATERRLAVSESTTIPEYGALIRVEDCKSGLYLREKALDAVQEQVIEDLNRSLLVLNDRAATIETPWEALHDLKAELSQALEYVQVAWEIAYAKRPEDDEA